LNTTDMSHLKIRQNVLINVTKSIYTHIPCTGIMHVGLRTEQKRYCTILFSYNRIYCEKPSKSAEECCWV